MLKNWLQWLQRRWRTLTRRRRIASVQMVENRRDLPNDLGAILYVVGKESTAMGCPKLPMWLRRAGQH
jgi:hypothetical protein